MREILLKSTSQNPPAIAFRLTLCFTTCNRNVNLAVTGPLTEINGGVKADFLPDGGFRNLPKIQHLLTIKSHPTLGDVHGSPIPVLCPP